MLKAEIDGLSLLKITSKTDLNVNCVSSDDTIKPRSPNIILPKHSSDTYKPIWHN